jgi:hypothetical protein
MHEQSGCSRHDGSPWKRFCSINGHLPVGPL